MKSLDSIFHSYWTDLSLTNAWRLTFEMNQHKKSIITGVMSSLPSSMGSIEFISDLADQRVIILFTHDLDNEGARKTLAKLYLALMETNALPLYGVEGAAGAFDLETYRNVAEPRYQEISSNILLDRRMLSSIEAAAFQSRDLPLLWGIDDPDLYVACINALREGSPDYWNLIDRRSPRLFENLLSKMDELNISVAAADVTDYNFDRGHEWLSSRKISHIGIRVVSSGETYYGFTDLELRAKEHIPTEKWLSWNKDTYISMFNPSSENGVSSTMSNRRPKSLLGIAVMLLVLILAAILLISANNQQSKIELGIFQVLADAKAGKIKTIEAETDSNEIRIVYKEDLEDLFVSRLETNDSITSLLLHAAVPVGSIEVRVVPQPFSKGLLPQLLLILAPILLLGLLLLWFMRELQKRAEQSRQTEI